VSERSRVGRSRPSRRIATTTDKVSGGRHTNIVATPAGTGRVLVRRPAKAAILRRQAAAALRAGRPAAWLTLVLYGARTQALKGISPTTARLAALMAASGDFGSGRRSRPGRALAAQMLGVSERTVERHWRLLEALAVAVMTTPGTWLSAERRAELADAPDERDRWRDRQEWHLVIPAWAHELTPTAAEALAVCEAEARRLLAELAAGTPATTRSTSTPAAAAVDNPDPAAPAASSRVAPSRSGSVSSWVQGISWFPQLRPPAGRQGGAAARHSPTRNGATSGPGRARYRGPQPGDQLARDVLRARRLPWLTRSPRYMLRAALSRFESAGWTAADIECETALRLQTTRHSIPAGGPARPVAFLRWLLAEAELERPPAQTHAAELAAEAAAAADRAQQRAENAERASWGGPGHQAAQAVARRAAGRAVGRRADATAAAAAERAAAAVRARTAGRHGG